MKKPQLVPIGITVMFVCVLLGMFLGRNVTRNYISVNNTNLSATVEASQDSHTNEGRMDINTAT